MYEITYPIYDVHPSPASPTIDHGHLRRKWCHIDPANGVRTSAARSNRQRTLLRTSGHNICRESWGFRPVKALIRHSGGCIPPAAAGNKWVAESQSWMRTCDDGCPSSI